MSKKMFRRFGSLLLAGLMTLATVVGDVVPVYADELIVTSDSDQVISEGLDSENPDAEVLLEEGNESALEGDNIVNDSLEIDSSDDPEEIGEISNDTSAYESDRDDESVSVNKIDDEGYETNNIIAEGAVLVDDYPVYLKAQPKDTIEDPWNFWNRECTSFVAWRLTNTNGADFHNRRNGSIFWGHAGNWGYAARELGITVDMNPTVGSVAWSRGSSYQFDPWTGSNGHVRWVAGVNGDDVEIEEYNYGNTGNYHSGVINRYSVDGYIHIKEINPCGRILGANEGAGRTIPDGDYQIISALGSDLTLDIQRGCYTGSE